MGFKEAGLRGSLRNVSVGASEIPDSGVTRLTFDDADTSGSTAIDVWGNNDGTINGATTGVSGIAGYDSGQAYSFDGVDDNVVVPNGILSGAFSVAFWFNADDVSSDGRIVSLRSDVGALIAVGRTGSGELSAGLDGTSNFDYKIGDVSADVTYFVGLAYDGSTWTAYLDDGQGLSLTDGQGTAPTDQNVIGESSGLSGNNYAGVVDDVRLFNQGLSATEFENLRTTGSISG